MGLPHGLEPSSDDEEVYKFIFNSGHECGRCKDEIMLTEEVYMLWVVSATMNGEFSVEPVQSEDGDFLYEPRFFNFECWEQNIYDSVDHPEEYVVVDNAAVFECSLCGSGILLDESFGQAVFGELRCSQRTPNGDITNLFHQLEEPDIICIACLKWINDEVCEMWDEGVDENGECDDGTYLRCWRYGCLEECENED